MPEHLNKIKVVITSGELVVAEELAAMISTIPAGVEVIKILSTVAEAKHYFKSNTLPDIIFSEVQLKEGAGFEIIPQTAMNIPVVYFAENKEYVFESYKKNGIDFLCRPFTKNAIRNALDKYHKLREHFITTGNGYINISASRGKAKNKNVSLIVNWKDKIIPVKIKEVALFSIEYKSTQAITFANKKYYISNTLEELEELCGTDFYRANRQFLINREAMVAAEQHFARKLLLNLNIEGDHQVIISKNKVPEFLNWLRGG